MGEGLLYCQRTAKPYGQTGQCSQNRRPRRVQQQRRVRPKAQEQGAESWSLCGREGDRLVKRHKLHTRQCGLSDNSERGNGRN